MRVPSNDKVSYAYICYPKLHHMCNTNQQVMPMHIPMQACCSLLITLSFSMPKSFGRKEKPVARIPLGQLTSPKGAGPVLPSSLRVRVEPKPEKKPPLVLHKVLEAVSVHMPLSSRLHLLHCGKRLACLCARMTAQF